MNWEALCTHPDLQNLPYKIEFNAKGQVIMSPAKLYHGQFQHKLGMLLEKHLGYGKILIEAAIQTFDSTKVTDVAWFSTDRWIQVKDAFEASIAPEICVEIISESDTNFPLQIT